MAASCLVLMQPAAADIIALKDGEKIRGTILREDGDHYVIEVIVSGTIRDERRIARADVKYIEKQTEGERAFDEIAGLVPTPDIMGKEAYEESIAKLEDFLKTHPESQKAEEAKAMLETLRAEHAIISAGGIKFGGEMVPAEDYEANAYEYDSLIAEKEIKGAVARRDFLSSLRLFSDYIVKFGESDGSSGMNALMLQVLGAYKASLDEHLSTLETRIEKRQSGLASMSPEDRANTERALEEQMERIARRFQKEKAAGQKWVTSDSFHKESMDEALRQVTSEIARLRSLPETMPLGLPPAEAYRVAWGKLADGTDEEKKLVLEEAKANRLPEFYLEKLRVRADLPEN